MGSKNLPITCGLIAAGILVILIVVLVPLSFKGLNYYEYGFKRRQSTGRVDKEKVYDAGKYAIGPDYNFKIFQADSHYLAFDNISVFAADKLEVTISASCQFFLRKEQLPYLLEQYDINYEPVLNKNALDALKGAATQFTTRQYIHERQHVEEILFEAIRSRLSGQCCEKECLEKDNCISGCVTYENCVQSDMGLYAEVRYFQLHDLSIPDDLSERYTQSLVLQEAEEREQYIQDAQLVRKETDKQVAEIENLASEINENATAYSTLIIAEATATSRATVEHARKQGLDLLYRELDITDPRHKATFDYLRTLKNMNGAHLSVNYDSLRLQHSAGSSRQRRDLSEVPDGANEDRDATTLSALDLWRDPSGVAALLDDWREKLAANPHKTTEADSPQ